MLMFLKNNDTIKSMDLENLYGNLHNYEEKKKLT